MDNYTKRTGVLRAVLEDIAGELALVVPEKEFVVEYDSLMLRPCLPAHVGPYYILYDGRKEEKERKPVLAVYQRVLPFTEKDNMASPLLFFMPPDPFIVEYLGKYAKEFNITLLDFSKV
ncbi:MAG: hypothetical protein V1734_05190 [Nanoarchaeota archaeon]